MLGCLVFFVVKESPRCHGCGFDEAFSFVWKHYCCCSVAEDWNLVVVVVSKQHPPIETYRVQQYVCVFFVWCMHDFIYLSKHVCYLG